MLTAIIVLVGMAVFFGLLLGYSAQKFKVEGNPVVDQIDQLLPQTQCGQCSFPGCRPYAEAIANQEVGINQCPPGGEATIQALADLLDMEALPLDETLPQATLPTVVIIREETCIGCTLCIQACPVDAIVGAAKLMHTVIADECTGCNLCLPPCPVDCIDIIPVAQTLQSWVSPEPSNLLQSGFQSLQTIPINVENKV